MTPPIRQQRYDVVAIEFPIVYDVDGDHDPDGLLYTLQAYLPLLDWARDRWEDDHNLLPRLHQRRQHMQIVVDGLGRYELMRAKLLAGPKEDRHLLHYRVGDDEEAALDPDADPKADPTFGPPLEAGADDHPEDCTDPDCDCEDQYLSPRAKTVRQNLHTTVDEILIALDHLTHGEIDRLPRTRAARLALAEHWRHGLEAATAATEERLVAIDADFDAAIADLAADSGLQPARIRRLLLNDHRTDVRGMGSRTPPYDRFNPLRPIPLVRPLVLRAALGDDLEVRFENQIRGRRVGMHVQGEGIGGRYVRANGALGPAGDGVVFGDGANVGRNAPRPAAPGQHGGLRAPAHLPLGGPARGRLGDQRPGRRARHRARQQRARAVRCVRRRARGCHLARPGNRRAADRHDVRGRPLRRTS